MGDGNVVRLCNAELTAAVTKLNAHNRQLQRQINAAQNRLAQHGIARPKFNSTHRNKFNDNRNTNKFNVNKDNERPPTYKSNDNLGQLGLLN